MDEDAKRRSGRGFRRQLIIAHYQIQMKDVLLVGFGAVGAICERWLIRDTSTSLDMFRFFDIAKEWQSEAHRRRKKQL